MPTYLLKARYSVEGADGVVRGGGSARRAAIQELAESLDGRLESFYFAFGGADAYVIAELPDNTTAAAIALTVNASGAAQVETVVLLSPEEIDQASQKSVPYRPPGA